ncbi:MAG TPA: YdcF family protein [Candidatus Scybalomonas excrementigallinarum]|nr:YdcF family protein [Candidatus Scybalomonas excrementigallinarum]
MNGKYIDVTKFVFVQDELNKADIIMIPGSSRVELAMEALRLYNSGLASWILISGGENKKLKDKTEAEFLRDILIENGVNPKSIIVEKKAQNTYENAKYSYEQCVLNGLPIDEIIIVCKSYHSRHVKLTYSEVFPEHCKINIAPIYDEDDITPDNWYKSAKKKRMVFSEIEKIGKYMNQNDCNKC